MMGILGIDIKQILDIQKFLSVVNTVFGQNYIFIFLVNFIVNIFLKLRSNFCHKLIKFSGFFESSAYYKRGSCFVYQNRVDFVDNRIVIRSLNEHIQTSRHIVTQVIKPKFVIGTVCNIAVISSLFSVEIIGCTTAGKDYTYRKPKKLVNFPHPFTVTFCKVIVHGDYVYTFACKSIQISRKGCD